MTQITRIAAIAVEPEKTLLVCWQDGRWDRVELAGWIATGGALLAPLKDQQVFATARVGEHGADVEWEGDDDLRIDAFHLAQLAVEQSRGFDPGAWQREIGLSNQEAADFFDVALSTWNAYRAGTSPIPGAVRIAARAALRDPLVMQAHYRPRQAGRPPQAKRAGLALESPREARKAAPKGLSEGDSGQRGWRTEGVTNGTPRTRRRGKQKKSP